VSGGQELVCEMGTDEAGAAGDEDLLSHVQEAWFPDCTR
jgi:hypothetical protein